MRVLVPFKSEITHLWMSETMKAKRYVVSLSSVLSSRLGYPSQLCHYLRLHCISQHRTVHTFYIIG